MSYTLTLELDDESYTAIRRDAEAAGVSPVDWVVRIIKRYRARPAHGAAAREQERQDAQELAELNAAYSDAPTAEERELQRRMWDVQQRQMAREPW